MKLASSILVSLFIGLSAQGQSKQITLAWNYPTNTIDAVDAFILHSSGNLSTPLTNWPGTAWSASVCVTTNLARGTNWECRLTLTVIPSEKYYYVTASNFWEESIPSNVASTPKVLVKGSDLGITRLP